MSAAVTHAKRFEFIAGARPLDFINTVSWGDGGEERLHDYADFLAWCRAAGLAPGNGRDGDMTPEWMLNPSQSRRPLQDPVEAPHDALQA